MKYPVLIIFMMVLISTFAFLMLIRVVKSELEILLYREPETSSRQQSE